MNQKLVELANKAGFKSAMFTDTKWEHSSKEDLRWYLWVCELERWLDDKVCNIDVDVLASQLEETLITYLKNS